MTLGIEWLITGSLKRTAYTAYCVCVEGSCGRVARALITDAEGTGFKTQIVHRIVQNLSLFTLQ